MKYFFLSMMSLVLIAVGSRQYSYALPPSYDQNFARHLLDGKPNAQWEVQSVRWFPIDKNKSLMENVRVLFYPDISWRGGFLRDFFRVIGFIVLVTMLILNGVMFFNGASDEWEVAKARTNFLYIWLGSGLFFWATRVLWTALRITNTGGTERLVTDLQNNVLFQVLAFLKAMAFFIAIIMIVYYGFRVIQGSDSEEKFNEAKTWILNIVVALIFIKLIDYIFFIAQQTDFKSRAIELIVQISRAMAYVLWFLFVVMLIYAGIRLLTSNGDEGTLTQARNIIFNIFLITIVIFLFLLIIYQVFSEFA